MSKSYSQHHHWMCRTVGISGSLDVEMRHSRKKKTAGSESSVENFATLKPLVGSVPNLSCFLMGKDAKPPLFIRAFKRA